jgi:AcrR family transcriptional regulator
MKTRERWLHEGLETLAESGTDGLTIESLVSRLGLTKGSFYHHFDGMPGYRRALLEYFEERENLAFIDRANAGPEPVGESRLRRVLADVMAADGGRPLLEKAVRTWASADPVARECLDRVDRARIEFAQRQFEEMEVDRQAAADFAQIAYLMSIGATHTMPPLDPPRIIRLWDRLLAAAASTADPVGP